MDGLTVGAGLHAARAIHMAVDGIGLMTADVVLYTRNPVENRKA
ncbi:hypothetical protein [Komagataeibacter medellinensis]|nr:hypothetical protein [Komagataeibacter medellinensis]